MSRSAGRGGRDQRRGRSRRPQVNVKIDRDKAAAMQVNASQIENALYDAYGPRWVSTIYGVGQRVQGAAGTEAGVPGGSARALAAVLQEPTTAS